MHVQHNANDLLVRIRLSFQKLSQNRCSTCRNNTRNVWEKSYDAYSLSIRVQTTINHISICFLPQYQRQRKCGFFFQSARRARAEKGIARHIDASSVVWLGPSNFWLVRSEHAHAGYPGLSFPPIWGGKKEEIRDWTRPNHFKNEQHIGSEKIYGPKNTLRSWR